MNRKDFILKTCAICIAGAGVSIIESCKSSNKILKAKLLGGKISVSKIELNSKKNIIIEVEELPYPVFISVNSQSEYRSFYMRCTHKDYKVDFKNNVFYCNNHGSRFNPFGKVIEGPAKSNLLELPVKISDEFISIDVSKVDI